MTPMRAWGCAAVLVVTLVTAVAAAPASSRTASPARHIAILCYHDLSSDPQTPLQTVPPEFLRQQIRDCRAAGWTFMSLAELLAHRRHPETLPPRTLVLTFDDGYRSFRDLALPVLREERVPATLAVISGFVDAAPPGTPALLGWDELRDLAREPGIEIASHSHGLHRYATCNPYRDTAPAAATRRYLLDAARYENREEYRARIRADLDTTRRLIADRAGVAPNVLVWPYGMHNEMARGLAAQAGFTATLALGGREVTVDDLRSGCLPRILVTRKFRFGAGDAAWLEPAPAAIRAADVDLDDVWSPDPAAMRDRVEQLVRRIQALGVNEVFLSVCSDTAADGRFTSAWCMNHQVLVRADVWSMVASKLSQARIRVWARIPSLNLSWSWQQHPEWRIASVGGPGSRLANTWPTRLSPDLPESKRAAIDFVTDLAVYAPLDGIVFDDDAAMAAGEHLNTARDASARDKAAAIDDLLGRCRDAVRAWRPDCRFARVIDARVVESTGVQSGSAQDFTRILRDNDLTIVVAPPAGSGLAVRRLEATGHLAIVRWRAANRGALRPAPVLLTLQALDRDAGHWLSARQLGELSSAALRSGVKNLGLRPVSPLAGDLPAGLFDARPAVDLATGEELYR